jgi:hypothetical protein
MDIELPKDFREFLRLLSAHGVEYVLVGGYAVGFHGYARATNDLDIWIALSRDNALKKNKEASGRFKDLNDFENLP